jgi:PhzF family phenazine biosynthesis protein
MGVAVRAEVVSAFVDERDGGNLAGVVLDRPDLSDVQMQSVAAQLGYAETAFLRGVDGGFRFEVFTPTTRVPDCGHATVASFGILAERGRFAAATTKFTVAGPRAIRVDDDGRIFMQQPPSTFSEGPDSRTIAASLGLSETTAFLAPPTVARHDVAFLIVPLPHAGQLAAAVPNMRAIEAISGTADVYGYYVYAPGETPDVDATTRMFAPRMGIAEESATGMAAGMLAAFLHERMASSRASFAFDQGVFMHPPSPSRLLASITLDGSTVTTVWVGGHARTRSVRTIEP